MVNFINIATTFLYQCNHKGQFTEKQIPTSFEFSFTEKSYKELENCKNHLSDDDWLDFCQPICEEFKLTKFNKYFAPNLKKYAKWILNAKKLLNQINEKESLDLAEDSNPMRSQNYLNLINSIKRQFNLDKKDNFIIVKRKMGFYTSLG